jgi:hypothetical protein
MRNRTTARTRELKEAIVASFSAEGDDVAMGLGGFTEADWKSVLWWLDISGMAIYFLDQTRRVGVTSLIPLAVEGDLAERSQRNRLRIQALKEEACTLAQWLENESIPYALLKGITLTPDSVSDPALRCQTDMDFLVAKESESLAFECVRRLGYKLHAKSGNTLELRAGEAGLPDMAKMYSVHAQRALELHLLPKENGISDLLNRRTTRDFDGAPIATLSPADILVQQALHLLKHLCGEHTRLSWVLEFWRHVEARRFDQKFWAEAEIFAAEEMNGDLALGAALWLADEFFGGASMELPMQWKAEALPPRIRRWLRLYARELLLGDSIGSKLYVLLRSEVPCRTEDIKKSHRFLFPHYMPARITQPRAGERLGERWVRYVIEGEFFLRRIRFHVVEGFRYTIEASRWRRDTVRYGR